MGRKWFFANYDIVLLGRRCRPRNEGPKGRFRNCIPNTDKHRRIENKNEAKHLQKIISFIPAGPHFWRKPGLLFPYSVWEV